MNINYFLQALDVLRFVLVGIAFYFGYSIGFENEYNPEAQLHFMIPLIITAVAGISGMEGLLFGDHSAKIKGYETGSNYQRQSSIALLSYTAASILAWYAELGIKAELVVLFAFLFFFFFSAVNHGVDAIRRKNYAWQNINRPLLVLLLISGILYPVIYALKKML